MCGVLRFSLRLAAGRANDSHATKAPSSPRHLRRLDLALQLFEEMKAAGVEADHIVFQSLISACERGKEYDRAVQLVCSMHTAGLCSTATTYANLITKVGRRAARVTVRPACCGLLCACVMVGKSRLAADGVVPHAHDRMQLGEGGEWQKGLDMFLEMQMAGMDAGTTICSALMATLRKANQPTRALALYNAMEASQTRPDAAVWNSALAAALALGKLDQAQNLYNVMAAQGVAVEKGSAVALGRALAS